jgi:glycyl-tRNA synthetase beta chain
MTDTLLIELLTEELPPKSLFWLSSTFAHNIWERLFDAGLRDADRAVTAFSTPRRLGVLITGVRDMQPERAIERKGPAVASGLDREGKPTQALLGFARSCGTTPEALERVSDGKVEFFVFRSRKAGESLDQHLSRIVAESVKALPIPKLMRWGDSAFEFARPVHGLVMLHGSRVVPGTVLGEESCNRTQGHRFIGNAEIAIARADDYEELLETQGRVIVNSSKRYGLIESKLQDQAKRGRCFRCNEISFCLFLLYYSTRPPSRPRAE